jgi:glutamate-1-semialdehyde 2,1-aminomutase
VTPTAVHTDWYARARLVTPGGVHSPVRAFASVSAPPLAVVSARGAGVTDTDGRTFIDYIGAWGPALLGHAHPGIEAAVVAAAARGLVFGLASPDEVTLAERLAARTPGCEMLRFTVTGTEATMSAVRVARAATGRRVVVKSAGGYHGHADAFLVSAGSGAATLSVPDSPGVPDVTAAATAVVRFNDLDSLDQALARHAGDVAAVILEPVVGNMGCVPPAAGYLEGVRDRCTRAGAVLIFDEVMSGLRVARGGAAERYGVTPDLVTLGKVAGGGMPLAAFGGRRALMTQVAPEGRVYHAGTYAAHPLSIAAGLAMLDAIDARPALYDDLDRAAARLEHGVREAARAADVPVQVQRVGSMWTAFLASRPIRSWDDAALVDRAAFARFHAGMLARGVLLPPSPFEAAFVSAAHDDGLIDRTIHAAGDALLEIRG